MAAPDMGIWMQRATVRLNSRKDAAKLDKLIANFAAQLAEYSEECMFCLSEPALGREARVVETETAETLARFIDFASPHLSIKAL
jgi:predicted secreted protein